MPESSGKKLKLPQSTKTRSHSTSAIRGCAKVSQFASCFSTPFLCVVIVAQWMIITVMLSLRHSHDIQTSTTENGPLLIPGAEKGATAVTPLSTTNNPLNSADPRTQTREMIESSINASIGDDPSLFKLGASDTSTMVEAQSDAGFYTPRPLPRRNYKGVAVTVLFRSPRWFHLRYTAMIQNAMAVLPDDWAIQIVLNKSWLEKEDVLSWHPGLARMINQYQESSSTNSTLFQSRVIITYIPDHLTRRSNKPKDVLGSKWFWREAVTVSDHVLLFSGNGAFCANHVYSRYNIADSSQMDPERRTGAYGSLLEELADTKVDFCGVPPARHSRHSNDGGDGSTHSYRNRQAMLRVLSLWEKDPKLHPGSSESAAVIETMRKWNAHLRKQQEGATSSASRTIVDEPEFRLASQDQTQLFGGVHKPSLDINITSSSASYLPPRVALIVSGTHPELSWNDRESLLKHCPEIKMIFPSMHEPTCFGAHPKPDSCRQSICALQNPLPKGGC